VLVAAGFGSALMLAGGALGRQVPTTTGKIRPATSTTITTPSVPTTTVTFPSGSTTTVTTTGVTSTSPPPSPPPPTAPPSATQPPPPPASPAPPSLPPAPSEGAPTPPASPPATPGGSSAASGSSSEPSAASAGASAGSSSGAAGSQSRTGTTSVAPDAGAGSRDAYRPPSQQRRYLLGLPSASSVAIDYGAFTAPVFAAAGDLRRFGPFGRSALRAGAANMLSLVNFPDFPRGGRTRPTSHAGSELPDVQGVLGDQATIKPGDGGGLTFGQFPVLALSLVLLSSLLLVGALLPPGVIAHTPVSPARFAGIRQRLALAAIAILLPVALVSLAAALS
jgi:hypothetical protein